MDASNAFEPAIKEGVKKTTKGGLELQIMDIKIAKK
jgi:hypothetical protein